MADALDLNYYNKNKIENYDLKDSNVFEIVVLLKEEKFKNRKKYSSKNYIST